MGPLGGRDLDYPRLLAAGVAIALLLTVGYAASTSGAAFGLYNPGWDGTAELRSQAEAVGTEADVLRNATAYEDRTPEGTLAVVLSPERAYGDVDAARISAFVREGGTLLVADDARGAGNRLLGALDAEARFDGATVRDERQFYRSPALPVAPHVGNHSVVAGVESLTLNYGTAIEPGNATVLVESSSYAYLDRDGDGALDETEELRRRPVATTEPLGNGTVVAVSDPSVFINAMVAQPGNERFARNLLGAHERVVFDVSHAGSLPPLALALAVLRESTAVQVALGVALVGMLVAWERRWYASVGARLWDGAARIWPGIREQAVTPGEGAGTGPGTGAGAVTTDGAAIARILRRRHPEWEDDRIQRLADALATAEGDGD